MKTIILCADDYGQNPTISQAIITLLEKNRLTATSCMVNSPFWNETALWLKPFQDKADIGLHFNLTEGLFLSDQSAMPSLSQLIMRAYSRRLELALIEKELHAQLDAFERAIGFLPRFIDGHQHIHQLPGIRKVLCRVYQTRLAGSGCYLRNTAMPVSAIQSVKALVIQLLGSRSLLRLCHQHHIPRNDSFAGIYDFQSDSFEKIFPKFFKGLQGKAIIMVHPGLSNQGIDDPIYHSRPDEYRYLLSQQFLEDCKAHDVQLIRF